jgi:hypothetical protein
MGLLQQIEVEVRRVADEGFAEPELGPIDRELTALEEMVGG